MVCPATLPGPAVETAGPVLGCYLVCSDGEREGDRGRDKERERERERESRGGVSMAAQLFIHMTYTANFGTG